jgi:hypothetical protein
MAAPRAEPVQLDVTELDASVNHGAILQVKSNSEDRRVAGWS